MDEKWGHSVPCGDIVFRRLLSVYFDLCHIAGACYGGGVLIDGQRRSTSQNHFKSRLF